ncbi:hypothetical protein ABZP36_025187 [Zizania latifolia]
MDAQAQHGVAASAGLAVIAVVLSVVHISGSRLNPAVTLAYASLAAALLAKGVYRPPRPAVIATVPRIGVSAGEAFVLELALTFVLVFVITAVATDPSSAIGKLVCLKFVQSEELIAMAIAAAIMMNALVAGKIKTSKFSTSSSILIHKNTKVRSLALRRKKNKMDAAGAAILPPIQTGENNRIAIIISPRAGSSKILPFELVDDGGSNVSSQRHSDPAEPSDETKHHLWHPGLPKIKAVPVPLVKKVIAEFFGTFILIFTVLSTIIMDEQHKGVESLLGIATSAGLAVTVLVLSLIHISGCHLNPAVSIAMTVFGHLPLAHLLPYMAAQVLGSIGASFAIKGLYHPVNPGIVTVPKVGTVEAFFLEFITTFILLLIITALATDLNAVKELIAVAVGATIMMNALVAGPSTGASMNPARTIGPAIATGRYTQIWVYLVATPLGAIAGTGTYYAIKL